MKFTRINSNTVNCIITADDMDEQGISIEDILGQSKEAMSFFQDIISRASEEVDYKPEGNVMPIQMAVLPDKSISKIPRLPLRICSRGLPINCSNF